MLVQLLRTTVTKTYFSLQREVFLFKEKYFSSERNTMRGMFCPVNSGRFSPEFQDYTCCKLIKDNLNQFYAPCPPVSAFLTSVPPKIEACRHTDTLTSICPLCLPVSAIRSLSSTCYQDSSCAVFGLGAVGLAVIYGCKMAGIFPALALLLHFRNPYIL